MNNIFDLHHDILTDYKHYIDSFLNIADNRILDVVRKDFATGNLYPEPLIQFNPAFESGGKVSDLVNEGILTNDFNNIYYDEQGQSWNIYMHQKEAIRKGNEGRGFIVTSGTGSGKSLTYISTIFNYLFKNPGKPGIKAIIVYPLNALINSQESALTGFEENYKKRIGTGLPFSFAKYTGQENQETRERIIENPPDILLTNYMMLELLLIRKSDQRLRESFLNHLQFLVFDELHVYKGRQGADVSLLIRRIKSAAKTANIICIGTSATMASGTIAGQKAEVARVAARFFDSRFDPDDIIIESLSCSTIGPLPTADELQHSMSTEFEDISKTALIRHPLAIWLERSIALIDEDGKFKRNAPESLQSIASKLAVETRIAEHLCSQKIAELLIGAESVNIESIKEKKKETILPFKLHQFISQTGYVYLTLENPDQRYITLEPEPFVKLPGDDQEVPVFQTVFSRVSGVEFICVRKEFQETAGMKFVFRDFNENQNPTNDDDLKSNDGETRRKIKNRSADQYTDGYLLFNEGNLTDLNDYIDLLPPAWKNKSGKIVSSKEFFLPILVFVKKDGTYSETPNGGEKAFFIAAPLIYDPTCGLIYQEPKLSEKSKLISLGNEGRSTSTTLISLQTLLALQKQKKPVREQKLLSFTDNRQDASLQAGHFNDFIQVVHLRSALEKVLRNAESALKISTLIFRVEEVLKLPETEYAVNPSPNPNRPDNDNTEALRNYFTYRIIQDLKRGWRYILPNLEQTALLEITYKEIDRISADETLWENTGFLKDWLAAQRKDFILQVLNYFRSLYAVDYEMLRYENRLRIESEMNQQLNKDKLWSLDKGEKLEAPNFLSLDGEGRGTRDIFVKSIGPFSRLGRFIKHEIRKAVGENLNNDEYKIFMNQLLGALHEAHYLVKKEVKADNGDKTAYQLDLSKVLWVKGDKKSVIADKISLLTLEQDIVIKPHLYFQKLYQLDFSQHEKSYIAAEHTGQISNDLKMEREEKFNDAKELSALYCSPTMELGIDISSLNIVHMRNVPPNPANYAQRSGRAGRNGQSALVFTYSSKVSPHDKHYFSQPVKMVAGIVQAPRIDLSNEELLKSHINATVLSFLNAEEFTPKLTDLIDTNEGTFKLKKDLKIKYQDVIDSRFSEILQLVRKILANIDLGDAKWFNENWLDSQIRTVPDKLESALLRWRRMYLDALRQMNEAHEKMMSPVLKDPEDKKTASLSYFRAKDRKELLENESAKSKNSSLSEFYTFRYLASEGFLPGYNFTRLPVRVFLGGKDKNESISRPRFMGLREFGPNNLIYHNGAKFKVIRITPNDVSLSLSSIKILKNTSYAYLNDEGKGINQDPITGKSLDAGDLDDYTNLLEFEEAQSESSERISCMEEVRTSEGYETELYLNTTDNLQNSTKIKLTIDGEELMKLFYAPAARLILLNKKWKRSNHEGFDIGSKSGFFKTKKQLEKPNPDDLPQNVKLFARDTSDILYIQPVKALGLTEEGVITLQYAIEKAIESYYNIEPVEIDARLMGKGENKNIMLYESAEGSIGVLKDLSRNPYKLSEVFKLAYEICGYDYQSRDDKFPGRAKASYDDLLSYYNQQDHSKIDRHSIIKALELLISANPDDTVGNTYENRYEQLKNGLHHRSPGERELLDYLYENGFHLPDFTNYNLEKYYVQPDFVYQNINALIFVDGGIHKKLLNKADDDRKRKILELAGYDVLVWDYTTETVSSFVSRRQDVFRKVR